MDVSEIRSLIDEMISKNSLIEIIDELAKKKCYHSLVSMVIKSKKVFDESEVDKLMKSHKYYSSKINVSNPFIEEFLEIVEKDKKNDDSSGC